MLRYMFKTVPQTICINCSLMISILIPVYNSDVVALARGLRREALECPFETEIIFLDDASDNNFLLQNRVLQSLEGIEYQELTKNVGRSAIRNRLATMARYDYLLFLDSDSQIPAKNFIRNYASHLAMNRVLIGGRSYDTAQPGKEHLMHWHYGRARESRSLKERQAHPVRYFHSNNIVLPRRSEPFFSEEIQGYGYEDLALGQSLQEEGFELMHLDNPILHVDLDSNNAFLNKHEEAARNLVRFLKKGNDLNTRLGATYLKLRNNRLGRIFLNYNARNPVKSRNRLLTTSYFLYHFDRYRLSLIHRIYDQI